MLQNSTTYFSATNSSLLTEPRRSGRLGFGWDEEECLNENDYYSSLGSTNNRCATRKQYLRPEERKQCATQLAEALEQYKLVHRRRFLTFEEIIAVLETLGYKK